MSKSAGESLGNAASQIAQLERAGIKGAGRNRLLTQLSQAGIDTGAATQAAALQRGFGGSTSADAIAGVIGGVSNLNAPGSPEEVLNAAARSAQFAKRLHLSPGQLVDAIAKVSQVEGSVEKGGEAVFSMLSKGAERPGGGLRLTGGDAALRARFGARGFTAAKILQGTGLGSADLTNADALGRLVGVTRGDPALQAVAEKRRAEEENAATQESMGTARLNRDAALSKREAERRRFLPEPVNQKFTEVETNAANTFGSVAAAEFVTGNPAQAIVMRLGEVVDWLRKIHRGTDRARTNVTPEHDK